MKFLTKSILTAAILMTPVAVFQASDVSAKSQEIKVSHHTKNVLADDLDVSQGWHVLDYSSNVEPNVDHVFKQGVETTTNQKCVMLQVGNMGDATLTAQKVIPMEKGHTYDLDLIYAQFYDAPGTGYIDFNGDRIEANNDPTDHHYKKTITPTENLNYTITVSLTTEYPNNAYFKIGYDMSDGNGGIKDTPSELTAPVVTPSPEAGTKTVTGTANKGNTVVVSDVDNNELGTAVVADNGKYQVTTSRALHYNEQLKVTQKNGDKVSPITTVTVVDTIKPDAPTLNVITDEDKEISGTTEPNATVDVTFENNDTYAATADANGKFTIQLDQTYHGKTKLTAKAIDEAGNQSDDTNTAVVFAHDLTIDLGPKHVSSIDEKMTGTTTRPNCDITIHFGSRIYTGKSDENGKFSIQIDKHIPGTQYSVVAVDPYDKEDPATVSDVVLPRIPNVTGLTAGNTLLTGVADPEADVSIELKRGTDTYNFNVKADAKGDFSLPLKDSEGNTLTLAVGDKITYFAELKDLGLKSDVSSLTLYAF